MYQLHGYFNSGRTLHFHISHKAINLFEKKKGLKGNQLLSHPGKYLAILLILLMYMILTSTLLFYSMGHLETWLLAL